ncbi:Putative glycoside hydrolase family 10 domain, glycoside hydrolase superfamily [Septoria linicola]|uniref:Beta-xylanase n=1 Tax=Septoria linicola TaxID=215465 RepID=A0A9Q9EIU1_9PEZI|nr:putative glycoside hydrolase family 10 domain, glycoside hydrolase superfamily [Septoria linicola]USW50688.1 Putative glycoside hydrolase family 10 domain, glycoside hydrolase superfamily [Septoria linicola]
MASPSLNTALRKYDKLYWGVATDDERLVDSMAIIAQHFGQITPENSMKWAAIHPLPDQYTFSTADNIVTLALNNRMLIRGHCLLWHRLLPKWVERITDPAELKLVIEEHITTVMSRYNGKIYAWDIINEPFLDDGTLRSNHFFNVLGESYIAIAFHAAKEADPHAKLYLNDYMTARAKIAGAAQHVKRWRDAGIPIDGIGVQGHVSRNESRRMCWTLRDLAAVVDEVAVTELDIVGAEPDEYVEVVRACLAEPKCVGITSWGLRDCDSWRAKEGVRCLLFDEEGGMKEACRAVLKELN